MHKIKKRLISDNFFIGIDFFAEDSQRNKRESVLSTYAEDHGALPVNECVEGS